MTNTTRDKMLETTTRLLRTQGFTGTGLNQIVKESKTPKGSLYYHFPGGKEQLAAEAIQGAGQMMVVRMQEAFDLTKTPRQALTAIIRVSAEELEASDFQCGCPIATVALEVAGSEGAVRDACQQAFVSAEKMLVRNLSAAGFSDDHAQSLAELMVTTYEGALLLSRALRSTQPLTNLVKSLPLLLPE
jgi:TetR/AcrR family transcriptional repressor of lmrAB and yxaGH operons